MRQEGSFKIEQQTCLPHLCPFPQPSSSEPLLPPTVAASGCCCLWGGGSLDTAAHLHQENTSIQFPVAEAVYPRYLYLSCTSDTVVFFFPVWLNVMLSWTHGGFCLFVPISPSSASQVIKQRCVLTSQVQTCPRFVPVNRKSSMW